MTRHPFNILRECCLASPLAETSWLEQTAGPSIRMVDMAELLDGAGDFPRGLREGWFTWGTDNRRAFVDQMPALLESFRGARVAIELAYSWHWARGAESGRPKGKSRFISVYKLNFEPSRTPFKPAALLKEIQRDVCASTDPRADRNAFELLEDAGCRDANGSFTPTHTGFVLGKDTQAAAVKAASYFPDCITRIAGARGDWQVTVVFPDMA